jgi:hypothetical protein
MSLLPRGWLLQHDDTDTCAMWMPRISIHGTSIMSGLNSPRFGAEGAALIALMSSRRVAR